MRGFLGTLSHCPHSIATRRKKNFFSILSPLFHLIPGAQCHSLASPCPLPSHEHHGSQPVISKLAAVLKGSNVRAEHHFPSRESYVESDKKNLNQFWSVISRIRSRKVEDIVQCLQSNKLCRRIHVSDAVVIDLLQKFGEDWKSALGFFQWAGQQSGYKLSAEVYNKMVDILGRMKQIDKMWMMVGEMHRRGLVTVETAAKVMRRLTGAGRWEDAVKTFEGLQSMGLEKDTETMNILLGTLCKEKKVYVAREVFLYYMADIAPDVLTFNILVHGWCLVGRIDEAEQTVLEMKGNGIFPSEVTYSTLLRAHCDQLNFCKVFELLDKMAVDGCPPNVVTYTSLINSFAGSEEIEAVFEIVERMRSAGCKPDIFFYNSLISILGRAGRLQEACHFFEVEMHQNGVSHHLSTYNTMISVLCHHSQGQKALDVLKNMECSPWKPGLHTFNPLLKLCIRAGNADDIFCNLLNDIVNKHHLSLDSATYALLIHGLCKAGKFECAFLLFEEMVSRDIPPRDRKTYDLLLVEAERRGLSDTVDRIKAFMKQF